MNLKELKNLVRNIITMDLNTNIIFNYVIHKTGDDFENLMNSIFQDKAKIGNDAWFVYTSERSANK